MLSALKFVQGAVAKKDFVPALTHFRIVGGYILGYNGALALCSPIEMNLNATPKAVPFIRAIAACKDTIALHVTAANRLSVKSGKFSAFIDCTTEEYPNVAPVGQDIAVDGPAFLAALHTLAPFIAEDASRPWARGILFRGPSAYATNNVVIVEKWLGVHFPVEVNIPKAAIAELLRINEPPERIQVTAESITFHFSGNRWLLSRTMSLEWPDINRILDQPCNPYPIPPALFESILDLVHFTDGLGTVIFNPDGSITTSADEGLGATVACEPFGAQGRYNIDQLRLLQSVAEQGDFTRYPAPSLFFGKGVRGAIIGMRIL